MFRILRFKDKFSNMIKEEELSESVTSSRICSRKGAINFKEILLTMLLYRIEGFSIGYLLTRSSIRLLNTRNWILNTRNAQKFNR